MSGPPPAARIDDPIGHASELGNFLAKAAGRLLGTIVDGLIIGAAAAAIVGATVLTGGVATVAIIAVTMSLGFMQNKASEAAGVELSFGKLGEVLADKIFPVKVTVTGKISTGSSNIFINRRKAVRATPELPLDEAICSRDSPIVLMAEGAEYVLFNRAVAVRKGDHTTCGAQVTEGSENVLIGGPQIRVRPVPDAIPKWARYLVKAVNIGLALYALVRCKPSNIKNLKSSFPCMLSFGMGAYGLYQSIVANPVHVATGAKVLDGSIDTDFVLPSALPIVWRRTYNSRDQRANTLFGQGWNTSFSVELRIASAPDGLLRSPVVPPGETCLIYVDDSGRQTIFPTLEPGHSHVSVAEGMELMRAESGEFVMRTIDGLHRVFDLPVEQESIDATNLAQLVLSHQTLLLRRIEDRNGNFIELRYDHNRRLNEITDSTYRLLTLEYARQFSVDDAASLRPASIRLVKGADGETPGELVRYRYDSSGQLNQVFNRQGVLVRSFGYTAMFDGPLTTDDPRLGPNAKSLSVSSYLMSSHVQASGLQCHYEWANYADGPRIARHWTNDGQTCAFEYAIQVDDGGQPDPQATLRGGATRVTDQLGRVQVWQWNGRYDCTAYSNAKNEITRFEYDELSQLTRETAPDGSVTELRWDDEGNLVSIVDSLGRRQTTRWVETLHLPSAHIDAMGRAWSYSYDLQGNMLSETDPLGNATLFDYEERGLPIAITDAKGGVKHLQWNTRALLVRYTDCSAQSTTYEWDGWGYLTRSTDALGYVTDFVHDSQGDLLALTTADAASQTFQYDKAGALQVSIDALGRRTQYGYNLRSQLTVRTDAEGRNVALVYDAALRLSQLVNENGESFEFTYDAADRLIEERRVGGQRVTVEYDVAGWPVAVTHHPGLGDDLLAANQDEHSSKTQTPEVPGWGDQRHSNSNINGSQSRRTELIRDAVGRLLEKRTTHHHYHFRYDDLDQLVSATKLKVVIQTQVRIDEIEATSEPDLLPLHTTSFAYDAVGNVVEETATDHVSGQTHTLRHSHDPLGNRTQTTLPPPRGESTIRALNYLYYGSGHLHQINYSQQASGEANSAQAVHQLICDIERDDLHREILRTQGKANTRFAYDPVGQLTGAWSQSASVVSQPFGPNNPGSQAWQRALESLASPATSANSGSANGLLKAWRYDKVGELRASRHSLQGDKAHQYDATGRILQTQQGMLAGVRNPLPQAANESFGYDPAGNIQDSATQQAVQNSTTLSQRGYVRDNLVRVFEDKRYFYDGHARLIRKLSGKHTDQRLEWDEENNLIAVHTTRRPGTEHETTQTTRFEYDAIGRRVAKHDSFGTTVFIWEGMRLIEERRGSAVISYVYELGSYVPLARLDADGERTEAGGLGATADPVLSESAKPVAGAADNDQPRKAANDSMEAQYWAALSSQGSRAALKTGTDRDTPKLCTVYYFHTDQIGMPQELSNEQGQLVWQASYKTWGSTVAEEWEVKTLEGGRVHPLDLGDSPEQSDEKLQNLRFQGQYLDRETGLHYNTFRYYDADVGRFLCPDPIGLYGGINLGTYSPNPLIWIDPWGLDVKTGSGRDHVTYRGTTTKGKAYTGYASAPSSLKLTPEQIIARRYNGDFAKFGGTAPESVYNGSGVNGKRTARGLEQHGFEQDVKKLGRKNVANAQNPVGENNKNRKKYKAAAEKHLNESGGCK